MKAYTDLEQSRKLAEILPHESADMWWREVSYGFYDIEAEIPKGWYDVPPKGFPCWSLAALLNYFREIDFFPEIDADEVMVTMNINYYDEEEARLLAPIHNIKVKAESFIDACVEMILKMHEQKLL